MLKLTKKEVAKIIHKAAGVEPKMFDNDIEPHEFEMQSTKSALSLFGETDKDTLYCYLGSTDDIDEENAIAETLLFEKTPKENGQGWVIEGVYDYTQNSQKTKGYFQGSISLTDNKNHQDALRLCKKMHAKRSINIINREMTDQKNALLKMIKMLDGDQEEIKTITKIQMQNTKEIMHAAAIEIKVSNKECEQ